MFKKTLFSLLMMASLIQADQPATAEPPITPVVIIGGGVGGGTAAIYLGRAGLSPIVIQGAIPGGAIIQSGAVENWPGVTEISGTELMERIHKQAEMNGALFREEEVVSVDFSKRPFTIVTHSVQHPDQLKTIRAANCILATGSVPNFLHIPGEHEYWGRGVSNCAICDGSLYRGKHVGVVGGGDAAVSEAIYLANIAKDVTIFVRNEKFKAVDEKKIVALLALPNVKVCFKTTLEEIQGNEQGLTGVKIGEKDVVSLDGLFLAIGSTPNTALFKGKIDLDEQGFIVLKNGQQTSISGVYAVGDAADPLYKQAISAAGDGAKAALAVQNQLSIAAPQFVEAPAKQKSSVVSPSVVEITSREQFEEELKNSDVPLVVDFYASWCSPCRRIAPKLESTAAQLGGKFKFLKVNVDRLGDLTRNFNIRSMPTVLYFNSDGTIMDRKVGEKEIGDLLINLSND